MRFWLALLLLCPLSLRADVLFLRNGSKIEGQITRMSATNITIQSAEGLQTVPKSSVQRITYGPVAKPEKPRETKKSEVKIDPTPEAPEAEPGRTELSEPSRPHSLSVVARSAIVPGWGHLAVGDTLVGSAYLGTGLALAGSTYALRSQALAAGARYRRTVLQSNLFSLGLASPGNSQQSLLTSYVLNNRAHRPYSAAVRNYNQLLMLDAAFYLGQLLHIALESSRPADQSFSRPVLHLALWPDFAPAPVAGRSIAAHVGLHFLLDFSHGYDR